MEVVRIILALFLLAMLDIYSSSADDAEHYFVGTNAVNWPGAKVACEEMAMRLAIIEAECEQEFLEGLIGDMNHWIGMTCTSSTNCSWIDDCPVEGYTVSSTNCSWIDDCPVEGYTNWHPNEPGDRDCVWTGYGNNQWDDDYCDVQRYYICECLDH